MKTMSINDSICWAEDHMAREDLKAQKRAQLWQPPELDVFMERIPRLPEIRELSLKKQADVAYNRLRYRFEGKFVFGYWRPAQIVGGEHIDADELADIQNKLNAAMRLKDLSVSNVSAELVGWVRRSIPMEIWEITVGVY